MNATIKMRLREKDRRDLESIIRARRPRNAGLKLSDAGREAIEEYIARHYRP